MTDPFRQAMSSELRDAIPRTHLAADEDEYVDYGDGIRTPPAEGTPPPDDYVDYGDGIRTPPGSESAPVDDYVDFGDGIRTPAEPSDPTEPDLRGESIELADGVSVGGTVPIHDLRAEESDSAFGAGAAPDAPAASADGFGSGATSPDAAPDTGAWVGDAPPMPEDGHAGEAIDPLAATDAATTFDPTDAFEAGDVHDAVAVDEVDPPDDGGGDGFDLVDG